MPELAKLKSALASVPRLRCSPGDQRSASERLFVARSGHCAAPRPTSAPGYERTFLKLRHYPEAPPIPDRPQGPFLANGANPRAGKLSAISRPPQRASAPAPPGRAA